MSVGSNTLKAKIEHELAKVSEADVVSHIRRLLVEPKVILRGWDYGEPGQRFPCWTVLEDASHSSDTGIAYCEAGFGPQCPWGLVWLTDDITDDQASIGQDCSWFPTFIDAFVESFASQGLMIWRVYREQPDGTMTPVTEKTEWDVAWQTRNDMQALDPASRYHCSHSLVLVV